jgi:seryl-tRNA synthetase
MLDIRLIREQPAAVRAGLARRQSGAEATIDQILALDERRRQLVTASDSLRGERKSVSKQIGHLRDASARPPLVERMRAVGDRITALEREVATVDQALRERLLELPNLPLAEVPDGASEHDNVILYQWGEPPPATADRWRPHWELGPALGILDFEAGVKLAGSRFYVLQGAGARLQRALIQWMLDYHVDESGRQELYLPFVVREQVLWAAGQLPKFRDNLYHDVEDDLWLVPTAEVPVTSLFADEILAPTRLPGRFIAYTPCFRREKMSAGRDTRGIKRGHQFDKVEMYSFCRPEDSPAELAAMLASAETLLQRLGLTYRVLQLCTADLGFGAQITYDLEVWAPGCGEWLEVSSISNVGDFQARRANIRFRREPAGRPEFCHTLNGSGLALPRLMIGLLETYQQPDGRICLPAPLHPYLGTPTIGS